MRILFGLVFLLQSFTVFATDVVLYYSPRCPYSQKVLSYIESNDIKIDLKDVSHDKDARDELKKYGGHLIVPCLLVDHKPIYNANDIIDWLSKHRLGYSD
jgi:glutaredoxin